MSGNKIYPYKGEKPFIFISYSHRNMDEAVSIIQLLQKDNYRVWYDEGIDPGSEWDENIASHVEKCGYFIALLSEEYLQSSNCKDELNYARELEKPRLLVYLKDVQLPGGMRMRMSRLQAIHKYKYSSEEIFIDKLEETQDLDLCRESFGITSEIIQADDLYYEFDSPRADVRLLYMVDTSGSMSGQRIDALNNALKASYKQLKDKYNDRVGVDILKYDSFASWRSTEDLPLVASGMTNYGAAFKRLFEYGKVIPEKTECCIVFTTDGYPTDQFKETLNSLKKEFWFSRAVKVALTIGDATNLSDVLEIVDTPAAIVNGGDDFSELLISSSVCAVAAAKLRHKGTYIDGRNVVDWLDNPSIVDEPLQWNLAADGTLRVSGGVMVDYYRPDPNVPWRKEREKINKIIIGQGMRMIGMQAFYDLPNLEEVKIPYSVTDIRPYAFANCPKLKKVHMSREPFEIDNYEVDFKYVPQNAVVLWKGVFDDTAYAGDPSWVPGTDFDY